MGGMVKMFEFEEKEQYTLDELKAIVEGFKSKVEETINAKEETIVGLTSKVEGLEELQGQFKELQIKNLALENGIGDDMLDLIRDDNLELVKNKIELVKGLQKEKEIDNSYKPENKRKDDDISKLEKDGNVEGMLKHKLGRLFG